MSPRRDRTLLWALRSPCNLACDYCYFGTLEEHRETPPTQPGQLSHLPHGDLPLSTITRFLSTAGDSGIGRVFLAGGEPLIWTGTPTVLRLLREAGIETTVCTNGVPLNRDHVRATLAEHAVGAVSVSLDSLDPAVNDSHRSARNHKDGWRTVVSGLRALLDDPAHTDTRVAVCTVISRHTLPTLAATAAFAADLGVHYFVPQPISLAHDHPLHAELSLRPEDVDTVTTVLDRVHREFGDRLALPAPAYTRQIASTITTHHQSVRSSFGGARLAFVQPDGSVWDCPSAYRITATVGTHRSIATATAADLFPAGPTGDGRECGVFSRDCVSMWPLMDFPALTGTT
ncbi:radical SAM protein [Actinokineospora cianjurensis]|uniref:MoaA/NifB/PqqE/SkfB family radical SAM enzyme n=1 Tax=Actinokineospora cianjurensis TaxID=585224 RepID=A0A421B1W8_9PSEU|nr:radical SAM protein [Actinokineospora cianjurensis]RLK58385.1 MoaA/NifB/PqqE/SkfB family radical SAM enzyme [Actinokineospora cianjurensis]